MPFKDLEKRRQYDRERAGRADRKEGRRRWREAHREQLQQYLATWHQAHLEYSREYGKQYNIEHRELHNENSRRYHAENREKTNEARHLWNLRNPIRRRWQSANNLARQRGVEGKLTFDEFKSLLAHVDIDTQTGLGGICPHCQQPFIPGTRQRFTLDHVIPVRLGGKHEFDNCQIICWAANDKKQDQTIRY